MSTLIAQNNNTNPEIDMDDREAGESTSTSDIEQDDLDY